MKVYTIVYAFCACLTFQSLGMFANNNVKVRIHVYDERKNPITNALVKVYTRRDRIASLGRSGSPKREIISACDLNGQAIAEFPCYTGEFSCYVEAQGYYKEYARDVRLRCGTPSFYSENLLEHDKDVTFTLRRKRNPIPLHFNSVSPTFITPRQSGVFGFDLKKNDWVQPFGKGEIADFQVHYDCHWDSTNLMCTGKLDFVEKDAGVYKRKCHASKSFVLDYSADTNMVFTRSIPFYVSAGPGRLKYARDYLLMDDEYFVVRSRVRHDLYGGIESANYSAIVGPFRIGRTFYFQNCYFNPTPNDTNLEYAERSNLTPRCDRVRH